MRFILVAVYQFLIFYTFSSTCQCFDKTKGVFLKKHTNWNGDLYAFNLVNFKNVTMDRLSNTVMIMHCKRASVKYLEGVEQIAINTSCNARTICAQNCSSQCLQIYDRVNTPIAPIRKVSNYAHQNYLVLQQRIFHPEHPTTAVTIFAASYDIFLDNQHKFLKVWILTGAQTRLHH
jgi:hypothetical protein